MVVTLQYSAVTYCTAQAALRFVSVASHTAAYQVELHVCRACDSKHTCRAVRSYHIAQLLTCSCCGDWSSPLCRTQLLSLS
jgi:hypothetical protein